VFDRFTDNAKRALAAARDAAIRLGHDYIGTEHLMLGLCAHAARMHAILAELGVDPQAVAAEVEATVKRGSVNVSGNLPFTPRAKKALELAMENAYRLGHKHIGTEHLLLGLLEEGKGIASAALKRLGVQPAALQAAVAKQCPPGHPGFTEAPLSTAVAEALRRAGTVAFQSGHPEVDVVHVLHALLQPRDGYARKWITSLGLTVDSVLDGLRRELDGLGRDPPR
jgi:ATP-dependent Clp protease ATP-binding subunit ClpC